MNKQYTVPNVGVSPPYINPPSYGSNTGCCSSICPGWCGSSSPGPSLPPPPGMGNNYGYQSNSGGCFGSCCGPSGMCGNMCGGPGGGCGLNSFCPCCTPTPPYPNHPSSGGALSTNNLQYMNSDPPCCGLFNCCL